MVEKNVVLSAVDVFVLALNKPKCKCQVKGCRKKAEKGRLTCRRCRERRHALTNPTTYSYSKLKYNAGQRGIAFHLNLAQWRAFCERTGYAHRRGKEALSASVDRIDPSKGYTLENIQVITLSENTLKKVADAKKGYVDAKIKGHVPPWERDDFDVGDYLG